MLLIIAELNFLTPDIKDQPQCNHHTAYGSVAVRRWWVMAWGPECLHTGWKTSHWPPSTEHHTAQSCCLLRLQNCGFELGYSLLPSHITWQGAGAWQAHSWEDHAVGNTYKAMLLGSCEAVGTSTWVGSPWMTFSHTGVKEDQIRFLLLVKNWQPIYQHPLIPLSSQPWIQDAIPKAVPKELLAHQGPSREEHQSLPRDEIRYAQSRGDLVFPTFTLRPIPQPHHDGDVTETDLFSSTMATEAAQSLRDFPGASRRDGAQPWGEKMAEAARQKPNLCRTQCLVHKN